MDTCVAMNEIIHEFLHFFPSGYIIEKADAGSNDWISCPGYATKTEYTVRGLVEGRKYVFRIRAENCVGVSDALTGKHVEARSPYDPPGPPGQPQVRDLIS